MGSFRDFVLVRMKGLEAKENECRSPSPDCRHDQLETVGLAEETEGRDLGWETGSS